MLTPVQKNFYRLRTALLKMILAFIPQPKPALLLGPDTALRLCAMIAQFGFRKVLVVTDKPLVELGMIAPLRAELERLGVESELFDAVEPDPTDSIVNAGAAQARQTACDAILAVGGGSAMDAGKIIAVSTNNSTNPLRSRGPILQSGLALFAVPTTSGTGSEVTIAAVITDLILILSHFIQVMLYYG